MATVTIRGFRAPCIKCGERTVRVSLVDTSEFRCDSCDAEYSADDVRGHIDAWQAVLTWIETAPPEL